MAGCGVGPAVGVADDRGEGPVAGCGAGPVVGGDDGCGVGPVAGRGAGRTEGGAESGAEGGADGRVGGGADGCGDGFVMTATLVAAREQRQAVGRPVSSECPDISLTRLRADD